MDELSNGSRLVLPVSVESKTSQQLVLEETSEREPGDEPRSRGDSRDSILSGDGILIEPDLGELSSGRGVLNGVSAGEETRARSDASRGGERRGKVDEQDGGRDDVSSEVSREITWGERVERKVRGVSRKRDDEEGATHRSELERKAKTRGQYGSEKSSSTRKHSLPCSMTGPIDLDFVHHSGFSIAS